MANPKDEMAKKLKKNTFHAIPDTALVELGKAMLDGKNKYGLMNWRGGNSVAASAYFDAQLRHLLAWWEGQQCAEDSGVHHLGHAMACNAILIDAERRGCLIDDRPAKGE
jgi:hypothetical protein